MTIQGIYRMTDLEEVLGHLHSIEESDGLIIALIGKINVLLPGEMAARLRELVGQRIGILRYEGYRLRVIDDLKKSPRKPADNNIYQLT